MSSKIFFLRINQLKFIYFSFLRSINLSLSIERNSSQRFGIFPTILRDIFCRTSKNELFHLNKEMTNLSTVLIESAEPNETLPHIKKNDSKCEICSVSDSPFYIVRV
jgi:hypothetical protein